MSTGRTTFQRASRLTQADEFRRVFSRPVVSKDRYFRVLSRSNASRHSRLGLAVSKKVCKRAVDRNRLKRLIRESFRQYEAAASDSADSENAMDPGGLDRLGLDYVVLPSSAAATMSNQRLSNALAEHWRVSVEKHRSQDRSPKGKH